jgi:hypothetical protein
MADWRTQVSTQARLQILHSLAQVHPTLAASLGVSFEKLEEMVLMTASSADLYKQYMISKMIHAPLQQVWNNLACH